MRRGTGVKAPGDLLRAGIGLAPASVRNQLQRGTVTRGRVVSDTHGSGPSSPSHDSAFAVSTSSRRGIPSLTLKAQAAMSGASTLPHAGKRRAR